jgi:hypothetical protein
MGYVYHQTKMLHLVGSGQDLKEEILMTRSKQEASSSPVLEVMVTFRSGQQVLVHMTEAIYEDLSTSQTLSRFFVPAPGYHKVFINLANIDALTVIDIVTEGDEYGDDEDQGPASTD